MIQVGQVLDKYELLERVGQGGMAVVYRGLDRVLKREVAVKVLHKHLSDYQEARDRFEREAQAVAKLRHENILEIFDYSGASTAEALDGSSYIVTEFIDGHTLKQVITDRPITFPEIGAMVVLQVARALAHAHHVGILHRDVKPENIMVRSDGVVKLMDFGISHMVDLERLTVTGQLLGSPAYMAPEHVEGRQLDFRTDVFAVGIVLYQLTVGKLPFEGKNPHEVLKRIAECKFVDPRQANTQIGNRLGRIILRAMAANPDDRFPAIGEMVVALEGYLEESGLAADKVPGELARYFKAPAAYEQALETRLVDHLTQRGQKLLNDDNRAAALDVFDRVLTIDPGNERVIAILDGINRRRRLRSLGLGALAAAAIVGGGVAIHMRPEVVSPTDSPGFEHRDDVLTSWVRTSEVGRDDRVVFTDVVDAAPSDATTSLATGDGPAARIDGPPVVVAAQRIVVRVAPAAGSEVQFGDEANFIGVGADGTITRDIDHDMTLRVRNSCCALGVQEVKVGQAEAVFDLIQNPGAIVAKCDWPNVITKLNEAPGDPKSRPRMITLDGEAPVFMGSMFTTRKVAIIFSSDTKNVTLLRTVPAGQKVEVSCNEQP